MIETSDYGLEAFVGHGHAHALPGGNFLYEVDHHNGTIHLGFCSHVGALRACWAYGERMRDSCMRERICTDIEDLQSAIVNSKGGRIPTKCNPRRLVEVV